MLFFNHSNFSNSTLGVMLSSNNFSQSTFQNCTWQNLYNGFMFYNSSYNYPYSEIIKIDSSQFSNCNNGILCQIFNSDNSLMIVSNSTFNNNINGTYYSGNDVAGYYSYKKCSFNNNTTNAIGFIIAGKIDSCWFNNNSTAVNMQHNSGGGVSYIQSFTTINSAFKNNGIGINTSHAPSQILDTISVSKSAFYNNQTGILLTNVANHNFLLNNIIDSNNIGISTPSSIISSNEIKFNGTGILTSNSKITNNNIAFNSVGINGSNSVKKNTITGNGIGIKSSSLLDSIYCNKIFNDTLYDVQYSTTSNAHIGSNDWGTRNDSLIHTKIYDGYTNIALGLVNFLPIDTAQCYLSSCHLVLTPTVTNATCDTCHNGKISVQTSGGGAPYHYTWYTTPLQTTATISNVKTGNYHFCVTDIRGCSACDTVFVDSVNCNAFHTTTKTIAATCATCNDGSAKITHSLSNAPYLFAWNTSPAQYTDSATALSYGTHIGCVTDHNNCQSCDTVFIDSTRCKNFAVQLSSTAVSCKTCNDGKAFSQVIAGTAPYSFSWNTTPVTTIDSITNQHFGMYTLHVTDANSCATTDSIYIDSVNCVGFIIQTFADSVSCNTCNNGKAWVHAQGGVMPYSYHWNTFPINLSDTIKNQQQGIYQVCVKDNQGCQLCQNVLIDSFNCGNMHVNAYGKNTTCGTCTNGAAWAVATGGATPYTYLWSTAQTTDSIKNIAIGNYIVAATDLHGCKSTDTIKIDSTICFGFQVAAHQINPTCNTCTDGSAWVNAIGGTAPYHYTWYTNPMQSAAAINQLAPNTYRVCVSDANTCAVCDTLDLTKTCSAQFQLYADTNLLHHYIAVNMASGVLPLHYLWSWGDGTTDTARYPNHLYAQAGFYTICLTIIDSVNCTNNYCDSFYLMRSKNSMVSISVVPAKHVATGVEQLTNSNEQLQVYPNPTTNELTIYKERLAIRAIEVRNMVGQMVICPLIFDNSTDNCKLNTEHLPSGIYFLKTTANSGVQQVTKFVKQ